jgi:hypothetical protein
VNLSGTLVSSKGQNHEIFMLHKAMLQHGQSLDTSQSMRLPVSLSLPKRSMPLHTNVSCTITNALLDKSKKSRRLGMPLLKKALLNAADKEHSPKGKHWRTANKTNKTLTTLAARFGMYGMEPGIR